MADSPCPTCSPNNPTCGNSATCDIRGDLLTNSCVCGTNLRPANADEGYRVFVDLANEYIIIVAEGVDCDTRCTFDEASDRCAEVPEVPGECRAIASTATTTTSSTSSSSVSTSTETPITPISSSTSSLTSSLPPPTILPTSISTSQIPSSTSSASSSLPVTPTPLSTSQSIPTTTPSSGFSIFSGSDDPQSTTEPASSGGSTSEDPDDQTSSIVSPTTQQTLSGSVLPIPFSSDTLLITSGSVTITSWNGTQSGSILPLTDASIPLTDSSVPLTTDNSRFTSQVTYLPASTSSGITLSSPELSSSRLGSVTSLLPSSNGANGQSIDGLTWATSVSAAQEPGQRLSHAEQELGGHGQGLSDQDQWLSAGLEIDPWGSNNEGALGGLVLTAGEGQQGPSYSAAVKATDLEIVVEASAASLSVNPIPFVLLLVHIFRL